MENRINHQIKSGEVRLVGLTEKYSDGVYSLLQATKIANELGQDLIEISPNANPPVCKIMEYSKFLYEQKKREKDNKKNQKSGQMKEMSLSPDIAEHDFMTKVNKSRQFLEKNDSVKVTLLFKGRAIVHKERGEITMLKFADMLKEVSTPDSMPRLEGKKMFFILKPTKK